LNYCNVHMCTGFVKVTRMLRLGEIDVKDYTIKIIKKDYLVFM